MLSNVFVLEFSKQKRLFFSAAFVILFTFGLVALRQWMMNQDLRESLSDWIAILLIGGIPLVAAVFGIAAAMGIRKEPERSAEEVLPIPPFTRSAGAYLTSFLLLFAIGVPLLILGIAMNSLLVFGDYGIERDIVMAATAVVYFHFLSFVLYYWIKDIFLAVVLTALVMFAHYQLFGFLRYISDWYNYPYHPTNIFNKTFLLNSVVSFSAVLLALFLLAKNIERGIRITLRRGISICLIILSGLAISAGIAIYASNVVKTALFPDFALWRGSFVNETRLGSGFLVSSNTGSKIRLNQNGERQVLYRSSDSELSWDREVPSILMRDGSAWVVANSDENSIDKYTLLFAPPGKPVREVSRFVSKRVSPRYFYLRGEELALRGSANVSDGSFYTSIPFAGKEPNWQPTGESEVYYEIENILIQQGVYAVLSKDGKVLKQTLPGGDTRTWILPGTGQSVARYSPHAVAPAFETGNQSHFVLPVVVGESARLMMCKPDGTVVTIWDNPLEVENRSNEALRLILVRWKPFPGGTAWFTLAKKDFLGPFRTMFFQDSNGVIFPPLDVDSVYEQIGIKQEETENFDYRSFDVRRATGSVIFVLLEGIPAEVDLQSGKVLKHYKRFIQHDDGVGKISPLSTQEGIYFIDDNRIGLLSWQGTVRDLGPAKLQ